MEFEKEYKKLNKAQEEAVDTINGPVMVVAGPGTGKTQILALRIANILGKTDIKADGVLCLTFTNSAVEAMKRRLLSYIGEAAEQVNIFTFHSFGMKIIEEHYKVLGLVSVPRLLDGADVAIIFDEILQGNSWQYLRPRGDNTRYFSPLRSLISLLKRERITSKYFLSEIEKEIKNIGKSVLKKDFKKIEGLERSREVVKFFNLYEEAKKAKNVLDYDDVLENLVKIVEESRNALADIRERYLYVLVDEHQDSSRVQNEFLKQVWGSVENPDIFVVGDDRQLIYGFSGASIDHFQGFRKTWKDAKLITLVDNYRSTQVILDASHALLESTLTSEKLVSQNKPARPNGRSGGEHHPVRLFEAQNPRDEIVACALDIKEKKIDLKNAAILVPKNKQVREALEILHQMGLKVSSLEALNLFDQDEAHALLRVLKIITKPEDTVSLAISFFDKASGIAPLEAHLYLAEHKESKAIKAWTQKLDKWKQGVNDKNKNNNLSELIQNIGTELLLNSKKDGKLVSGKEILDTVLSLAVKEIEKNPDLTLVQFTTFLARLESYNEHIPLIMEEKEGVKVLTLHSSKGLEFDYVWIAHMDERSLNSGKKIGFVLPESIAERVEERDIDAVKRKLYVAITRAKRFCTLSYALYSFGGAGQEAASVIQELPEAILEKHKVGNLEKKSKGQKNNDLPELVKLVAKKYTDRKVSVSLLNNFFECPWKWYFRNLLGLPEEKTESLIFGDKVHKAIDQILKQRKVVLPDDKEVAGVVLRWAESRLKDIAENRENEKSVSVKDNKFPHLNIYGKIDLVEHLPARHADASHAGGSKNELRVTDFKTGSVRKKSDIEKLDEESRMSGYLRQLAMYSYLLGGNVRESRLEFLEAKDPKESIYNRVITPKEIALLLKDIQDYDQLVKSGEWTERPCNYNSYGKTLPPAGGCEYCRRAEIYR